MYRELWIRFSKEVKLNEMYLNFYKSRYIQKWSQWESNRNTDRPHLTFRKSPVEKQHFRFSSLNLLWLQRESNPHLTFRKRLFYPLNYDAFLIISFLNLPVTILQISLKTIKYQTQKNCFPITNNQ
jgi:hypothetical protein